MTVHTTCCGATARRNVFEYFNRGWKNRQLPHLPVSASQPTRANNLWAWFSAQVAVNDHQQQVIQELRFQCPSCTTLVACCQVLTERFKGALIADLLQQHPRDLLMQLLDAVSGIPLSKRDRAWLAICAFLACVHSQEMVQQVEMSS
ncbi:MAG TPA: iron-sulfur cluster assembly scaffold protein [Paenalcaligenes sp.]|nr:iron-sulfur cluster assembly scaffold protein [Paenalcaligenes sp.]